MSISNTRQLIQKWFSLVGTRFNRFRKLPRATRPKLSLLQLEHRITPTASVINSWGFLGQASEGTSTSITLFAPQQITATCAYPVVGADADLASTLTPSPTIFQVRSASTSSTVLQAGIAIAQARIQQVATSSNYASLMTDVFGRASTDTRDFANRLGLLRQALISGDMDLKVELLDNSQMPMARAAYTPAGLDGTETILLNRAYMTDTASSYAVADLLRETCFQRSVFGFGVGGGDGHGGSGQAAVAAFNDPRLYVAVGATPGPTTKADCLNSLWRAALSWTPWFWRLARLRLRAWARCP
jgi:hypothetical protein